MQEYEFYVARVDGFKPSPNSEHFTYYLGDTEPRDHLDNAFHFASFNSAQKGCYELLNEASKRGGEHLSADVLHFKCVPQVINIA